MGESSVQDLFYALSLKNSFDPESNSDNLVQLTVEEETRKYPKAFRGIASTLDPYTGMLSESIRAEGMKMLTFNGVLKYESGVHRVQRVPATETQGRVHTSAATVAVLPEAEEVDVVLNPADIRKDTYCSSGPGGQSVNTTYSAIRLTHIPTGIVVTCQDEKSQIKNLAKAMTELRSRIYAIEHQKYLDEIASKRRTMVSTGDRSAKIRTYNYPQGRVTDHRINLTLYNLAAVMDGDLDEIIEKLQIEENTEKLRESGF